MTVMTRESKPLCMITITKRHLWVAISITITIVMLVAAQNVLSRPQWEETIPSLWTQVTGDGSSLMVTVYGGVDSEVRVNVSETPVSVQLKGWTKYLSQGDRPAIAVPYTVEVSLQSPLDGRQVIDSNGNPIAQQTH